MDNNPTSWTKEKNLSFKISDKGSGVKYYGFSSSTSVEPKKWKEVTVKNLVEINKIDVDLSDFAEDDSLYIWAKDAAGNDNKGLTNTEFNVNIDSSAADGGISIDYSPKRPTYAKTATLTGSAEDSKSGLVAYAFATKELKKDDAQWIDIEKTNTKIIYNDNKLAIEDGNYYFCVKDAVDNVACEKTRVDSTDNDVNLVNISLVTSDYLSATLRISGSDLRSGIAAYCVGTNKDSCNNYISLSSVTKSLDTTYTVNSNGTYYLFIKDDLGNVKSSAKSSNTSAVVTTIDEEAAEGGISLTAEPKVPIYAKIATLKGEAIDTKSGLVAYAFSKNELTKDSSGWISIATTNSKITPTNNTLANTNETYYFCVKDAVGNTICTSTKVNSVDNDGPVLQSGGSVSKGKVTNTTWSDVSTPIEVYYLMTTLSSPPSSSTFSSTSRTFDMSQCSQTYYVWVKAVDRIGNETIKLLGTYTSGSEGVWQYSSCTSDGYKKYTRYNACLEKNEEKITTEACEYPLSCTSTYGECQENSTQTRQCPVMYGGSIKDVEESQACTYYPIMDAIWVCQENSFYWGCNGNYHLVSGFSDYWGCTSVRYNLFYWYHECWGCATQYDQNGQRIPYKRYGNNQCKKA